MSSTKRDKPTAAQSARLWKSLEDSAIQDDIDSVLSMSDADLDAYISANGGDPAKLRARGEALAKELDESRVRLAWHGAMEQKLATVRASAAALRAVPREKLSRDELLARIAVARRDPRFTTPVATLFRSKTPEASTDEELQALLDQITLLTGLEDD